MFVFKILSDKSILKVVLYLRLNSGFVFLIKVFSYRSGSDCHLSPAAPAYFSVTSKFSKSLPFSLNLNKSKKIFFVVSYYWQMMQTICLGLLGPLMWATAPMVCCYIYIKLWPHLCTACSSSPWGLMKYHLSKTWWKLPIDFLRVRILGLVHTLLAT